jgi:hypothetical protein
LQSPRYPLSPDVEALRSIVEKLEGEEKRQPTRSWSPAKVNEVDPIGGTTWIGLLVGSLAVPLS